jgi:nitrite reductase/ring-hydroxylating ferredoxin subunit
MTAARVADLDGHDVLGVVCDGVPIVLCRWKGTVSALLDRCPHQGVKLSGGCLVEGFIECPQHFGLFDVRTGASGGGVTMHAAKTVPTRMVGGVIEVDLEHVR